MAEALGVASAGVGIASFAIQVVSRVHALETTYRYNKNKVSIDLESLSRRLKAMQLILYTLQPLEGNPLIDLAVGDCCLIYSKADLALESLIKDVQSAAAIEGNGLKSARRLLSRKAQRQVREIESELDSMHNCLTVPLLVHISQIVVPNAVGEPMLPDSTPNGPGEPTGEQSTALTKPQIAKTSFFIPSAPGPPHIRRISCNVRRCHCSCHLTESSSGRYWGLEYTPLSVFLGNCDNKWCDSSQFSWKLRLSFNKFSIPWATSAKFELISDGGKLTIRPSLSVQSVVDYTSLGFGTLWKCRNRLISLSEAREEFYELKKRGPLSQHVNPNGDSYIRSLLCNGPWRMQDEQFALFALFTREFGMTLEKEEQGLLIKCAAWIGEGRHLDLLDSILESGFDPSMTDSPPLKKWPAPCSPDWISEEFTQDPFFLEYLATLLKACPGECKIYGALVAYIDEQPGFAGSTPLQDAILTQSIGSVRLILSKIDRLDDNRNFLGQTPLHLATTDPELFGILLDAGYDMNGTDRWGITPLMYAAAMGIEQVVKMLVSKGADLSAPCEHLNRDFVHYASARGHWGLLLEIADTIQSFHDEESFQNYVSSCIFDLIFSTPWEENSRTTYFCRLLELSDDVNFTIEDLWTGTNNNNLLHYSRQPTDVQTLVRCGFRGFNQPNSRGQLPIFSIVQRVSNVDLTRCCLKNGIDVNHIDRDGRTVLFMLLPKLSSLTGATWDVIDSIKLCLAWGLDISLSDGCICPCLSHGCDTSSAFNLNFKSTIFRDLPSFVWAFEWLSLIEEFCSYESSKATLLSFIRRKYSEVIEITHFCCHGGYGVRTSPHWDYSSRIAPDDVDEILDEEEELIDRLEAVMQLHTSSNIQTLKSQLMMLLKEGYDKQFDEFENQRKRKAENPKYDAIHKSDSFQNAVGLTNFQYSLVHSMAQYAFWLQHEHFRSKNCSPSVPVKDGWYERRLSWYTELMSIMQVPVQQIVQMMKEIHVTESRSEGIDRNDTSDQFYASIFRILSLSGNMGANI